MKIKNLWKYLGIFHFQHGIFELNQVTVEVAHNKLPMYYGKQGLWNMLMFRYEKKNL
jgi:hypothetical protein